MDRSSKRWAVGALLAALVGYIAGILTAPKSGRETREDIRRAAQNGMVEAEKKLKKLHTQMATLINEAKEQIESLSGTAKKDLQAAIDKAAVAKEKAREMLSALHEGDAQDDELKKAIKEADKALERLMNQLRK